MMATDPLVIAFNEPVTPKDVPDHFPDPFQQEPHAIAIHAALEFQEKLNTQLRGHEFDLADSRGRQRTGKMFGVLVVKAKDGSLGYLAGYSGTLGHRQSKVDFVPPISDGVMPGGFLDTGLKVLDDYKERIEALGTSPADEAKRVALSEEMRVHSRVLNDQIYDRFHLFNGAGESKSIRAIFQETHHANPPGGAGDCAAPRLLQYAFRQGLDPIAMAEFWWGRSFTATPWQHRTFYPPCTHKCRPILHHMLKGLVG